MDCNFVIYDSVTGLYLTSYSTRLENCSWGNLKDALCFETKELADAAIATWGDTTGRFSSNPPNPHH